MICLICRQAKIVDGLTSITFERGEMKVGFNNVPARICSSCGEAYVEEEVAVQLLREMAEMSEAGIRDVVREYELGY